MMIISMELLCSFSIELLCCIITCFCDVITVVLLIIDFKRKKTESRTSNPTQSLSVHRKSHKR